MRTWTVLIKVLDTVDTNPKTTRYRYRNEISGIAHLYHQHQYATW